MATSYGLSGMPPELTEAHRQRYLSWYETYREQIGGFAGADIQAALSTSYGEAVQSGIDTPSRFFLYATARLLMPDMQAAHYLVTMDVIFSDLPESRKIERITELSRRSVETLVSAYST